jgi:hypothetical protein
VEDTESEGEQEEHDLAVNTDEDPIAISNGFNDDQVLSWKWPRFDERTEVGTQKTVTGLSGEEWTIYSSRDNDTLTKISKAKGIALDKLIKLASINPSLAWEGMEDRLLQANTLVVIKFDKLRGRNQDGKRIKRKK